jgi:probable rRNA maturation factor
VNEFIEINYEGIDENTEVEDVLKTVAKACFETEKLDKTDLYLSVTLSDEEYIHKINREYRKIDRATDVLSFPMFQKEEIPKQSTGIEDILGDIIICIPIVERQAVEYEHSFKRELAYMLVHGFYHLMGYDHMEENEKKIMRENEEKVLSKLNIID